MKQLTCIVCPLGCLIKADFSGEKYVFSGNKCEKGALFAESELTDPMRTLSTTVRTIFPEVPVLPVKISAEVKKMKIPEIIRELSYIIINERLGINDIVVSNISETGCDVIVTSNILKERFII